MKKNTQTTPAISVRNLSKKFEGNGNALSVLKDINLEIQPGEFFVILGPSGSGKSTLLRAMSGLEKQYTGTIEFGPNIDEGDISFVFQQFALLPWLTVYENIEMNLLAKTMTESERRKAINNELKRFGLKKFASSYPRDLSGGMRQRVGLARAFAPQPKIIFMDEPFSELDSFTAQELRTEFLHIWKESHETVVMVTHLLEEAVELADRIAVLTPLPGQIEKIITNTMPRPRKKRSPKFWKLEDELYRTVKP